MRIRKYLREMKKSNPNSSFTLNYVPQPVICRLNQSPWDVATFIPSDTEEADTEHAEEVNTTFRLFGVDISTNPHRSVPQSDVSSSACVHQEEPEKDDEGSVEARKGGDDACKPSGEASEGRPSRKRKGKGIVVEEITLCPELERNGWQCAKPVKPGFNMCPRHWKNISPLAGRKSIKKSPSGKN